jgi:hypothetical protein
MNPPTPPADETLHGVFLLLFLRRLTIKFCNINSGLIEHRHGEFVRVAFLIDDSVNSSIDDHLGADDAGVVRTIEGRPTDPNAMIGGLNDGILFRMEATAEFMAFSRGDFQLLTEAADVQTMIHPGRSSVITRGENLFIFHKDRPHLSSKASGALRDEMGDVHEILIPRGAMATGDLFFFLLQRQPMQGEEAQIPITKSQMASNPESAYSNDPRRFCSFEVLIIGLWLRFGCCCLGFNASTFKGMMPPRSTLASFVFEGFDLIEAPLMSSTLEGGI